MNPLTYPISSDHLIMLAYAVKSDLPLTKLSASFAKFFYLSKLQLRLTL